MEWCRFVTYLWNDPRISETITHAGVPAVLKFLKLQSCPEIG